MIVLGIESSCDETAASVVLDGRIMLSNIIASQIDVHRKYGGVVPEIASRKHVEAIVPVILESLEEADVTLEQIDGVAVTCGPGLVGSLLVGLSTAKAIAYARQIPLVGVNHLEGHIAAVFLMETPPELPFIALVVSGGHTNIYLVTSDGRYNLKGQTKDDAAGEAFDKAAKMLNIGYPGGVVIDGMARNGDRRKYDFPRAMRDVNDFSFSGLKTSLLNMLKKRSSPFTTEELNDVAASYQEAIVDVLVEKTLRVAGQSGTRRVVVCGGVASNSRLRARFREDGEKENIEVFVPPPVLCTDNAGMIAAAGYLLLKQGILSGLDLNAVSRWPANIC
ncbi:MAG: tRNA (adenosine(37)-N6)-threonylcarbamoyltransferase complex transferase subunit TsaD [Deltaproteobacteria bacterium]|nr:tRNA (adenosine(37)-N6)-threonylcarbamoyltransferase complex transferase subunit TsaD [Deltaproteobacteria bacterium]